MIKTSDSFIAGAGRSPRWKEGGSGAARHRGACLGEVCSAVISACCQHCSTLPLMPFWGRLTAS